MEGKNMFFKDYHRDYVISARDRCYFTIDRVRAVTTSRYKYIRSFMTDRPFMQPQYRDNNTYMLDMKNEYLEGRINKEQFFMWSKKES